MTTEERLEKLERELAESKRRNRWLLSFVELAVVGLGLFWLLTKTPASAAVAATAAPTPKEIRANSFVVVDEKGNSRAMLGMVKNKNTEMVMLKLFDEMGNSLAMLNVGKDRSMLILHGEGKSRILLGVSKDLPGLLLLDESGNPSASLGRLQGRTKAETD